MVCVYILQKYTTENELVLEGNIKMEKVKKEPKGEFVLVISNYNEKVKKKHKEDV